MVNWGISGANAKPLYLRTAPDCGRQQQRQPAPHYACYSWLHVRRNITATFPLTHLSPSLRPLIISIFHNQLISFDLLPPISQGNRKGAIYLIWLDQNLCYGSSWWVWIYEYSGQITVEVLSVFILLVIVLWRVEIRSYSPTLKHLTRIKPKHKGEGYSDTLERDRGR